MTYDDLNGYLNTMRFVSFYLLSLLGLLFGLLYFSLNNILPYWTSPIELWLRVAFWGGLGSLIYCIRGVYVNYAVRDNWDEKWGVWYFWRPWVGGLCGIASCLFLHAGLIVLETSLVEESSKYGFYVFAFVAGYNCSGFLDRVEEIARATWGLKKSKASIGSGRSERL